MKKLTLIALIVCLAFNYAYAQRKIEYGFTLGGGLGIQHIDNSSILNNNSVRTFNANIVVNIPVLDQYYLRTGLGLANKGTVITEDALTTTNKITYFEIPVLLARKYDVPTLGKIIAGVGGYAAMGSSGTLTYETPNSNTSNNVTFGNENDFKKYDAGLSLLAGLALNNRLTFNLGYDFGLSNIASQPLKDSDYKSVYNREFTITLGLIF
ncbi:MAG: outer membrane beta-barrel protein [Bacteroidota bacterium]